MFLFTHHEQKAAWHDLARPPSLLHKELRVGRWCQIHHTATMVCHAATMVRHAVTLVSHAVTLVSHAVALVRHTRLDHRLHFRSRFWSAKRCLGRCHSRSDGINVASKFTTWCLLKRLNLLQLRGSMSTSALLGSLSMQSNPPAINMVCMWDATPGLFFNSSKRLSTTISASAQRR